MLESVHVHANGLRFRVLEEGEGDRLALCLHGFPELGRSWRHQLPLLAELGYRGWAPDLRGYGGTERPRRVCDYALETLMDDVTGLIAAAGAERATLIAHDWGGLIAWHVAMRRPELLERLVVCNMPHPQRLAEAMIRGPQLVRSFYALLFQLPWLPERMLSADDGRRVENAFTSMAVDPGRFTERDLRLYREAALEPGALTAMLAYYRAYVRGGGALRQMRRGYPAIDVPTLLVWGEQDTALGRETTLGTSELVRELTVRYVPQASHWVQQEAPEVVNAMLRAWLTGQPVPQAWEVDVSDESRALDRMSDRG
ncbi:MAG TPA: alpha/beta hydrolase [Sandaracinaceae bacterium LLY-WYZ-13_1]|nr:alpha/beta hydrolase [Sandaracinaceae bacterium LLY-WYZ-13_1]